jgi:proteasome-associated ATPase
MSDETVQGNGADGGEPIEQVDAVADQVELLGAEVAQLRRQARFDPLRIRELEHRLASLQTSLATLSAQNERLVRTLQGRPRADRHPQVRGRPARPATERLWRGGRDRFERRQSVDILTSGRKMRVALSPSVPDGAGLAGP